MILSTSLEPRGHKGNSRGEASERGRFAPRRLGWVNAITGDQQNDPKKDGCKHGNQRSGEQRGGGSKVEGEAATSVEEGRGGKASRIVWEESQKKENKLRANLLRKSKEDSSLVLRTPAGGFRGIQVIKRKNNYNQREKWDERGPTREN